VLIDVIVKRPGVEPPPLAEGGARYLVASNGVFLERKTPIFLSSCRVDSRIAGLDPHVEDCVLRFGRIPAVLSRAMLSFFRRAFDLHGGEAALILLYDPKARRFSWHCPEQTVDLHEGWSGRWYASSHITYTTPSDLPPHLLVLGDAHSHADFPANASHTDLEDERYKDGLHIIAGRVDRERVDVAVEFVMDGRRFDVRPEEVFAEPVLRPLAETPKSWMGKVRVRRFSYGHWNAERR
jgi:hypothetical protein